MSLGGLLVEGIDKERCRISTSIDSKHKIDDLYFHLAECHGDSKGDDLIRAACNNPLRAAVTATLSISTSINITNTNKFVAFKVTEFV